MIAVRREMSRMESSAEQCDAGLRYFLDRARRDDAWGWAMVNIGALRLLFGAETSTSAEQTIAEGIEVGEFVIADASVGRDLVLGTAHARSSPTFAKAAHQTCRKSPPGCTVGSWREGRCDQSDRRP
jgi:hypothetical protein